MNINKTTPAQAHEMAMISPSVNDESFSVGTMLVGVGSVGSTSPTLDAKDSGSALRTVPSDRVTVNLFPLTADSNNAKVEVKLDSESEELGSNTNFTMMLPSVNVMLVMRDSLMFIVLAIVSVTSSIN